MEKPLLVLQYPDLNQGRTIAIAATRNLAAMRIFKQAVLEDARLNMLDWQQDEVLEMQSRADFHRLQETLDLLIPD